MSLNVIKKLNHLISNLFQVSLRRIYIDINYQDKMKKFKVKNYFENELLVDWSFDQNLGQTLNEPNNKYTNLKKFHVYYFILFKHTRV